MEKPKTIINKEYLKQFREFSQLVNPKPSESERERLRNEYLKRRKSS